jgi:hypothetical protein
VRGTLGKIDTLLWGADVFVPAALTDVCLGEMAETVEAVEAQA